MSLKPRLRTEIQLKQGLSPQLHQSIRLMGLTGVELSDEIQHALEENPFLESAQETQPWDPLPVTAGQREHQTGLGEADHWLETLEQPQTLQDYLRWQCELTPFTPDERALAEMIIESINEEGYLLAPLQEILPADLEPEYHELAHIVLHRIQQFDPAGVGAQDLKECLSIQIAQLSPQTEITQRALELIAEDLSAIHARPEILNLVQTLHPKPGLLYGPVKTEYLIPDLIVRQEGERHEVYLNEALVPRLQLNHSYSQALKQEEHPSLVEQLNAAKSLIYQISLRQQTLLTVARCIMNTQQSFFNQGPQGLKPLKLDEISEATGFHNSTVSRLTCNKYIHTPRGLFALKYFLSGAVSADEGPISSRAVQALIAEWIRQENKHKALSDQALVNKLADRGIILARRTVAKYREALGIPTKSLRKLT